MASVLVCIPTKIRLSNLPVVVVDRQQGSMKNEWPWREQGSLDDELTVDECILKDLYKYSWTV